MLKFYIFALIFGFGVIIVDLFGLLNGDSDGDTDGDSGEDGPGDDGDQGDDGVDLDADDDGVSMPDNKRGRWIYTILNILRSVVYFAVGFGAVGLFGTLSNRGFAYTLLWSTGTGLVVLTLVKLVMRIQSKTVDSQLNHGDLFLAEAEVLVTIQPGKIGRIRVETGGSYHDMFAKGKDPSREYSPGSRVYIVDLSQADPIVHDEKE